MSNEENEILPPVSLVHPVSNNNNQLKNGVNFYINPENDIMLVTVRYPVSCHKDLN